MDDCVLEFLLPEDMEMHFLSSKRELLINKVLRTLQRKCLKMWEVSVREVNETSGSEVRLVDERMSNIPLEENGYMTVNPTSNQAEETREPLQQVLFYTLSHFFFLMNELIVYILYLFFI